MGKEICTVCGREIDSRGMSGHMRTHSNTSSARPPKGSQHKGKKDDTDGGVISYPSNEQEIKKTDAVVDLDESPRKPPSKPTRKQVNSGASHAGHPEKPGVKPVTSKPASKPASNPPGNPQVNDPRGERKTKAEHKADIAATGHTEDYAGSTNTGHPKDSGAHRSREWQGLFRD